MSLINFETPEGDLVDVEITDLIIAGWAGRDQVAVEAHIAELAELGVKRPRTTPCFYRVSSELLTTSPSIQTSGTGASGEAEVVLIQTSQGLKLGVGSDHTDRVVEGYNVTVSKQMCAKPVSSLLWDFSDIADHWDSLQLKCWRQKGTAFELYQHGPLSSLLPPLELVEKLTGTSNLPTGWAMFCGTQPVLGELGYGDAFEIALIDPVLNREIRHRYKVESLVMED